MAVPRAQRGQLIRVRIDRAAEVREFFEEALEAGRGDDLEDPARLVARVPERVPLVARLEDQVARARLDDVVTEQRSHATLENEAVLVLTRVLVERGGQRPRRHGVIDDRQPVAGLRSVDDEPDADAPEETLVAVPGADDPRRGGRRLHLRTPFIEQ